jgi:hypothetical protein
MNLQKARNECSCGPVLRCLPAETAGPHKAVIKMASLQVEI